MSFQDGFSKFQGEIFPSMSGHFEGLKDGQEPWALVITCSDSRIDPSLIAQSKPGDLFVIRNAGNIVPEYGEGEFAVQGTIEYAVQVLGVGEVIVCGHSQCGAMKGLLDLDSLSGIPAVKSWVTQSDEILPLVENAEDKVNSAIEENVKLQMRRLSAYPYIADRVSDGKIKVSGCIYHFENGQLNWVS